MNTPTTTTTDARGRVWPAEGAELVRTWNRCRPLRKHCDAYRMTSFIGTVRRIMQRNLDGYSPSGPSRNRCGAGNRRMRKHLATQPRVIFSTPFFDITE